MSEYYSSNTSNKLNSQNLSIKKCLQWGPHFRFCSKCECIFFFEVTMFFSVPGTSSRHCQSGGIRAHKRVLRKIGHFPRISRFFFLHSSVYRYTWGTPSNFFHYISLWTFRNIVYNFLLCPVSISWVMNAQKNSKFERKDKRNGNTLLHYGFFSFFHENVDMNI